MTADEGLLRSPLSKLQWANVHLDQLGHEVDVHRTARPYVITNERDVDRRQYRFHVRDLHPTPPHWGLLVGDCVHNARSALDHLIFALALRHVGRPLTDKEARGLSFPVFTDPVQFKGAAAKGNRAISLLREVDRARIKQLQPYEAKNTTLWGPVPHPGSPVPVLLRVLSDLDNTDKHRFIEPLWHNVSNAIKPNLPAPFTVSHAVVTTEPLEDGTQVGIWTFHDQVPDELPDDMNVYPYFRIEPRLDLTSSYSRTDSPILPLEVTQSLLTLLQYCVSSVQRVIWLFSPAVVFGHDPRPITDLIPKG